jgi:plastocyanin
MGAGSRAGSRVALRVGSRAAVIAAVPAVFLAACAGGDGATPPAAIGSVEVTAPTAAASFQTLGRTLQFSAQARTTGGDVVPGATIAWSSSTPSVAAISASGLLTVVGNGTTQVRAAVGAVQSTPLTVTVAQVAANLAVQPTSVLFGALASSRQLQAVVADSGTAPVTSAPAVSWSLLGPGTTAGVSADGRVTALAVGNVDTVLATAGALTAKVPITVTQIVASVLVTADGSDTLATTGRTRTYSGVPRDSNANVVPGVPVAWSSTQPSVASIDASTGVATAASDGTTGIRGTAGTGVGERALTVRRYAATFELTPTTADITTPNGTQLFEGTALDSTATPLTISWLTRSAAVLTLAPATGATTTATATGNGATFVVMTGGTRADSASVTVSGQSTVPLTATVHIGDSFFRSTRNLTENAAIDTIGLGGVVTWLWTGTLLHNVDSQGTPSFSSSVLQTSGQYQVTFSAAGTYEYICQVHPSMTGRIVVR